MSSRVSFGRFQFDPAVGMLTREGARVRLQPQPARVLAILLARAGDVVTREELRREIWSDGTTVDFERGLNFSIAQVRSALGDDADSPLYVETLPRRGYRFIAPVQDTPAEVAVPGPTETTARPRRRRAWAALAAAPAILVALWLVNAEDHRVRVAVVPFDNETGMEDLDAVARGIADATVARLATPERLDHLRVIGNSAALERPRSFRDVKRIGDDLDVDYVVLAQMKRDEAGVRLIAHLIRASDETHEWANAYDREAFTLADQAEIAESIAGEAFRCLTEGCRKPPGATP